MEQEPKIYSIGTEQIILGGLLNDNSALYQMADLKEEHFYEPLHGRIFRHIEARINMGEEVTVSSIMTWFRDNTAVQELADKERYFASIAAMASGVVNLRSYAGQVIELANRRSFFAALKEMAERAGDMNDETSVAEMTEGIFSSCMDMTQGERALRPRSFMQVAGDILRDMEEDLPCYSTGLPILDEAMGGGLYANKTYCIAARPKNGKTILLSTISMNMALRDIPHIYVAAEMGEREIHQRNIARSIGENSIAFIQKRKDADFIRRVIHKSKSQSQSAYFVDAPGITFDGLRRVVMTAIKRQGVKGIILDYLQLVGGRGRNESRVEHEEKVASWLAQIAKQEKIFVLYAAQRNREGSLRGGDAILMAVDQLYYLEFDDEKRMAWMDMVATRYTVKRGVGDKSNPRLRMHRNGPHFKDSEERMDNDDGGNYG